MANLPADFNLHVAVAALGVGRYQLAHECALAAEHGFKNRRVPLPRADELYLVYYSVMISRWARHELGEVLPDKSFYYPPMSDEDVAAVDPQWRRQFPLVKEGIIP